MRFEGQLCYKRMNDYYKKLQNAQMLAFPEYWTPIENRAGTDANIIEVEKNSDEWIRLAANF